MQLPANYPIHINRSLVILDVLSDVSVFVLCVELCCWGVLILPWDAGCPEQTAAPHVVVPNLCFLVAILPWLVWVATYVVHHPRKCLWEITSIFLSGPFTSSSVRQSVDGKRWWRYLLTKSVSARLKFSIERFIIHPNSKQISWKETYGGRSSTVLSLTHESCAHTTGSRCSGFTDSQYNIMSVFCGCLWQ